MQQSLSSQNRKKQVPGGNTGLPSCFFPSIFLSCFADCPKRSLQMFPQASRPPQHSGQMLTRWSMMTNTPLPDVLCRCYHCLAPCPASLGSCLPRTMLPQVAGSIWVASLGAEQRSVGQSAGGAAGVGGAVLYQTDPGSQTRTKALTKIKKEGEILRHHLR